MPPSWRRSFSLMSLANSSSGSGNTSSAYIDPSSSSDYPTSRSQLAEYGRCPLPHSHLLHHSQGRRCASVPAIQPSHPCGNRGELAISIPPHGLWRNTGLQSHDEARSLPVVLDLMVAAGAGTQGRELIAHEIAVLAHCNNVNALMQRSECG